MAKVESKFIYDDDVWTFEGKKRGIKIYINEDSWRMLITDLEDEIIAIIRADCNQNEASLNIYFEKKVTDVDA